MLNTARSKMELLACLRDRVDEKLSGIIFHTSLPAIIELFLSIPGACFGVTPGTPFASLCIACLVGHYENPMALHVVTVAVSIQVLAAWFSYVLGNSLSMEKLLFNLKLYMVFPPCAVFLCYCLIPDRQTFSKCVYPLTIFMPIVVSEYVLKTMVGRERPCEKYNNLWEKKYLIAIPKLLAKIGKNGSFPSTDASVAAAFAIPLAKEYPNVAIALVFLTCFGRVYFLAHYVLDTIAGIMITFFIDSLATNVIGLDMEELSWWHPLLSHFCGVFYFIVNNTRGMK